MADRWSGEQNKKFVELYKRETHLWNFNDPGYKDRNKRIQSLELIRDEMGMNSTKEVTNKIKNFRSTYNQELIKMKKNMMNGDNYKPALKWFDSMDHIMKIVRLTKEKEAEQNQSSTYEHSDDSSEANYQNFDDSVASHGSIQISSIESITKKQIVKPKTSMVQKIGVIQTAVDELKELTKSITSELTKAAAPEDESEVFGRHVAMQLKQLPLMERIDATNEIQCLLFNYRKKALCSATPFAYFCVPQEGTEGEAASSSLPTKVEAIDYEEEPDSMTS